ncbi:hypothetical protein IW261DRAFT_1413969 [Armillaria novae-zelandiae]|uniref:Uncharacterized protein n=1 Tax=Armillaria novae-zelandiae TaxID=153914 RepID=A0AA39ULW8_9AGAR|nr:hypothetical protein IW261DRAFT_1413969 [Armillaria novae-zelandiae]
MPSLTLLPISDIPVDLNMGATFGAIYTGATIAAIFYGITVLQTVIYYKQNSNDPWIFRYAVALLWILDTLHVALSTHALYFYLVESFGSYLSLFTIIWSFPLQLVINMLIVFGVQLYVSFSAFSLMIGKAQFSVLQIIRHQNLEIRPPFSRDSSSVHCTGIYVIYDTYTLSSFLGISTIRVSIYTVFSTIAGADFIIAGSMCFYLHKGRSMTSFSSGRLHFTKALNSRKSPMWSAAEERPCEQKMLKFAPHDSSNGAIDSGKTNLTVPPSIMERSQFTGSMADTTFA